MPQGKINIPNSYNKSKKPLIIFNPSFLVSGTVLGAKPLVSNSLYLRPASNSKYKDKSYPNISLRFTHSIAGNPETSNPVVPVLIYDDAEISKLQSVKENRGKSGIYR
jgi:hypothetical protein